MYVLSLIKRLEALLGQTSDFSIFVAMDTARHIENLLYRYQCVVMPDFGAFLTQIKPAYLQKDSNSFHPPSKIVTFNSQLRTNDGLLASHIAQAAQISYEDALELIENQARSWSQELYREGQLNIEPLGTFRLNSEKKVQFRPAEKINFLTASFGLGPVIAAPILREELHQEVAELEERIPFTITPKARKTEGLRPLLKYAAVILLSLTAGMSGFTLLRNNSMAGRELRIAAQEAVARQIQEATFFGSEPMELTSITLEVSKKHTGRHHIITGAFRLMENAEKKIRQLKQRGYDARYLGVNRFGLHQVACGSFEEPRRALEALKAIKRDVSPDAWLLSEK